MMCENDECSCKKNSPFTNKEILCVVEDTTDVLAIQNTNHYNGLFHVIGGLISPIDGIGPEELNISTLIKRVQEMKLEKLFLHLVLH